MSELSRCGRVYHSLDEAVAAAEQRAFKTDVAWSATGCPFGDHWHVIEKGKVIGQQKRYRPDPFPPLVQKIIDKRDIGQCQRCGNFKRLERHHRRAKGSGGSKARSHTQCPCNALSLCRECHEYVHLHPARARERGWIVSQAVARPGAIKVTRFMTSLHYAADIQWLTCDGRWVDCQAETEDS